ncbi:MAG TPA: dienelactone hydrolase family protein [Ilumatobacteraceae bacterium]|nr:dienelactone hydrolase family protein [Ilumatobacteraceae bacterium]
MHIADIEYFSNGLRLVGQIAVDDSRDGKRPAVLVSHEGNGLSDHAKNSARKLAELGYVAFALDYYGDGKMLPDDQIAPRCTALIEDPLLTRALGRAGLDVLLASEYADTSKVAAIGYCFGGTMSLELGRDGADLQAIVGFHSGLATSLPDDAANITGSVLVCIGTEDPLIPPEQRLAFEEEMRAGGVDWRMHLYGGAVHSFTNPAADGSNPVLAYEPRADARSWRAMLDLFTEKFGG